MNVQCVSVWKEPLYSKAIVFGLVALMTVAEPLGIRTRDCSLARVQNMLSHVGDTHSLSLTFILRCLQKVLCGFTKSNSSQNLEKEVNKNTNFLTVKLPILLTANLAFCLL
jgi:hypothetical protein